MPEAIFVYGYHVNTEIHIHTEFHIHVCYSLQVGKSLDLYTSKGKVHMHFHEYHQQEMASGTNFYNYSFTSQTLKLYNAHAQR